MWVGFITHKKQQCRPWGLKMNMDGRSQWQTMPVTSHSIIYVSSPFSSFSDFLSLSTSCRCLWLTHLSVCCICLDCEFYQCFVHEDTIFIFIRDKASSLNDSSASMIMQQTQSLLSPSLSMYHWLYKLSFVKLTHDYNWIFQLMSFMCFSKLSPQWPSLNVCTWLGWLTRHIYSRLRTIVLW